MTVKQRQAGIVGDEIHFDAAAVGADYYRVLSDAGGFSSIDAG